MELVCLRLIDFEMWFDISYFVLAKVLKSKIPAEFQPIFLQQFTAIGMDSSTFCLFTPNIEYVRGIKVVQTPAEAYHWVSKSHS